MSNHIAALGCLAILVVACSSATPPQSPIPSSSTLGRPASPSATIGASPIATAVRGGAATLAVSIGTPMIAPGDQAVIDAVVTNGGNTPLHYPGGVGACKYGGDFWFDFSTPKLDAGRAWSSDQETLKDMLMSGYPGSLPLGSLRSGCDAAGPPAVLAPGGSVQVSSTWDGRFGDGFPAPPGIYTLNVRFALFEPPDDDFAPLSVTLPVQVVAAPAPISPGRALDFALANVVVAQWLKDHPIRDWSARPSFVYRPDSADYRLLLADQRGAQLVAMIANDGRGPVGVQTSTDQNFETEPPPS